MSVAVIYPWPRALAPALLGLAAMASLVACESSPTAIAVAVAAPKNDAPCPALTQYTCRTCGTLSAACRTAQSLKNIKSARCTKALSRLKSMLGHPPNYGRYCSFASWIVRMMRSSAEPVACRRYRFEVCRRCGSTAPACKSLQAEKGKDAAVCQTGIKAWRNMRPPSRQPICRLVSAGKPIPTGKPIPAGKPIPTGGAK
jgi:hypothetical protein